MNNNYFAWLSPGAPLSDRHLTIPLVSKFRTELSNKQMPTPKTSIFKLQAWVLWCAIIERIFVLWWKLLVWQSWKGKLVSSRDTRVQIIHIDKQGKGALRLGNVRTKTCFYCECRKTQTENLWFGLFKLNIFPTTQGNFYQLTNL